MNVVQNCGILAAGAVPEVLKFVIPLNIAIFGFIIGVWVYVARREKKRTAQLQQIAEQLGFEFFPKGDAAFLANLQAIGFSVFNRSRQKLVNLMRGKSQRIEVAICDYSYVVQSGEHSNVSRQTVIYFQSAALALPQFMLSPKTFFHKIGSLFTSKNIEFENHPLFDKNYVLRGHDADAIRQLFTEDVLLFFDQNPGWQSEGLDQNLVLHKPGKRLPSAEISGLLETGLQVLSLLHSGG
jgi:hypothetical protein